MSTAPTLSRWTQPQNEHLLDLVDRGYTSDRISKETGRTKGAVDMQISRLRANESVQRRHDGKTDWAPLLDLPPWLISAFGGEIKRKPWHHGKLIEFGGTDKFTLVANENHGRLTISPIEADRFRLFRREFMGEQL